VRRRPAGIVSLVCCEMDGDDHTVAVRDPVAEETIDSATD
jgi:hypothetical protein